LPVTLPEIPSFNALLGSLQFHRPAGAGYEQFELVPERMLSANEAPFRSDPLQLWYRKTGELSIEGVIDRVGKELEAKGHGCDALTSRAFFGLHVLIAPAGRSPVAILNLLLDHVGPVESSDYLIYAFPPYPGFQPFRIGDFTIGPLDRERLEYWCRKVRCDFFDRYPQAFRSRFAIERLPAVVQAVRLGTLKGSFRQTAPPVADSIVDFYFERLTHRRRNLFLRDLKEAQAVPVAAGAPFLDLEQAAVWGGSFVAVFTNLGDDGNGYFCPLNMVATLDFASVDRRFPETLQMLRDRYGYTKSDESEIHNTLTTFCRFVMLARILEADRRIDDALLYYVIALDLLLGDRNAPTRSVVQRAAIIAAPAVGRPYREMTQVVAAAYDSRSRYVHSGIPAEERLLRDLKPIVDEVIRCLLRLQANTANRAEGSVDRWLKRLDLFAAAEDAGEQIGSAKLAEAGIASREGVE
jgi:hypothetical protein